jgi:hypothetical protein
MDKHVRSSAANDSAINPENKGAPLAKVFPKHRARLQKTILT